MHASCARNYQNGEAACLLCEMELDEWEAAKEAERLGTIAKPNAPRLFS